MPFVIMADRAKKIVYNNRKCRSFANVYSISEEVINNRYRYLSVLFDFGRVNFNQICSSNASQNKFNRRQIRLRINFLFVTFREVFNRYSLLLSARKNTHYDSYRHVITGL